VAKSLHKSSPIFPSACPKLREVWLADGRMRRRASRKCSGAGSPPARGGQAIFHFAGIDTYGGRRGSARLRGADPFEQRAKLDVGKLLRRRSGRMRGVGRAGAARGAGRGPRCRISRWRRATGRRDNRMAKCSCRSPRTFAASIDIQAKRIDVILPEGLRDLNRKLSYGTHGVPHTSYLRVGVWIQPFRQFEVGIKPEKSKPPHVKTTCGAPHVLVSLSF
jgi:hypothetical protein